MTCNQHQQTHEKLPSYCTSTYYHPRGSYITTSIIVLLQYNVKNKKILFYFEDITYMICKVYTVYSAYVLIYLQYKVINTSLCSTNPPIVKVICSDLGVKMVASHNDP